MFSSMSRERYGETDKRPADERSRLVRNCREVHSQVALQLATIVATFVLFCAPLASEAQPPGKMYRVGLVSLGGDPFWWRPVLEAMRELGYVEGRNLTITRAFAKGHPENLPRLVT